MHLRKRVLVTGGSGFLGSHLCARLLDEGHEVLCVDNFFSSARSNVEELMDNKRFELLRHDVTFPLFVEVDEIYNLACPASPVHYQHDPVQTIKTCVHGAINMLGLAKRLKARIFQASTSEVYGDPDVHPQPESYWGHVNPNGIRSCYDEGKRCAEALFFSYRRQNNVNIKVGRIFNTYGPKMHPNDGRVVSNFIVQALKGEPITIYGDGSQTRSFCYVDDLVECMCRLMATPDDFTGPVNMGNPGEFTIRELAEKVITLTNSSSKLICEPLPGDDPKQRRPDISLAREVLGWEPKVQLEEGLKKTIAYFDEQIRKGLALMSVSGAGDADERHAALGRTVRRRPRSGRTHIWMRRPGKAAQGGSVPAGTDAQPQPLTDRESVCPSGMGAASLRGRSARTMPPEKFPQMRSCPWQGRIVYFDGLNVGVCSCF